MRIIKPYGKSVVQAGDKGNLSESLRQRNIIVRKGMNGNKEETIAEFLQRDEAKLAQWVSALDKIIAKPLDENAMKICIRSLQRNAVKPAEVSERVANNNKTAANARKILGKAIWAVLTDNQRSHSLKKPDKQAERWKKKCDETNKNAKMRRDFPQGRWYKLFVGAVDPKDIDEVKATEIAGNIYKHFYENAITVGREEGAVKHKGSGALLHRASFIERNTLKRANEKHERFSDRFDLNSPEARMAVYKYMNKGGDIAEKIKKKILAQFDENTPKEQKVKDSVYIIAVKELKEKWKDIFGAGVIDIAAAKKYDEPLFKLHQTVKEAYKRLLKGRPLFPEKLSEKIDKDLSAGHFPDNKQEEKAKAKARAKAKRKAIKEKLEQILPGTMRELLGLIQSKNKNYDVNSLIRLGKIIHYTAAQAAQKKANEGEQKVSGGNVSEQKNIDLWDKVAFITRSENWPSKDEVGCSFYWSSRGQTYIKQNEAFVRIWRRALAFAARTLQDWTGIIDDDDVLKHSNIDKILQEFYCGRFDKKYQLLFGSVLESQNVFSKEILKKLENLSDEDRKCRICGFKKELLEFSLEGIAALRNAAFHFKGLETFIDALSFKKIAAGEGHADILAILKAVHEKDAEKYKKRLAAVMDSAHFHDYFSDGQIKKILGAIITAETPILPLPRLPRVLERAENGWNRKTKSQQDYTLQLPHYSTAQEREDSAWLMCQWTAAKQLYDTAFAGSLNKLPQEKLKEYIQTALNNTTAAARAMNGKNADDAAKELITAKAGKVLDELKEGESIQDFFDELMRATASALGVQNGYQSHGGNAQEQSKHLENLKCDIVAQAFAEYLPRVFDEEEAMELFCKKERAIKPNNNCNIHGLLAGLLAEDNACREAGEQEKIWQDKLYYLLHLMPVEEVGSLRHQLKKWEIVTDKGESKDKREKSRKFAQKILAVFDLYMKMHDAQFVAEEVRADKENNQLELDEETGRSLFATPDNFDSIFKRNGEQGDDKLPPVRDLRELQRFGNFVLESVYLNHKISDDDVNDWLQEDEKRKNKEGIAADQQRKIALHDEWKSAKNKKEWEQVKGTEYHKLVKSVTDFAQLTARVRLQDHLRLHRLLMAVIGRLIDFSGLWERDLYFTMLALIFQKQQRELQEGKQPIEGNYPRKQFEDKANKLKGGQIVAAFRKLKDENIKQELVKLFNVCKVQDIRDRFAHLAMLEKEQQPIDLTKEVNFARQLMSYDRKLKNAVSKSVIELLAREKLKLEWEICVCAESGLHNLSKTTLESEQDYHLKKTKTSKSKICVPHYGKNYVTMVRNLFKPA